MHWRRHWFYAINLTFMPTMRNNALQHGKRFGPDRLERFDFLGTLSHTL